MLTDIVAFIFAGEIISIIISILHSQDWNIFPAFKNLHQMIFFSANY